MRKICVVGILVFLCAAVGCQSLMHTLTLGLWPDKEVSTTQPSAVTPSTPTTADTWHELALVGVVFGVAIGLATWKLPFLTVPLVAVMSALGILIVVEMLLKTILVGLLIIAVLAAIGFLLWVFVLKKTVAQAQAVISTVVDGVENAGNPVVKKQIAAIAELRGTAAPLDAVLDARGYRDTPVPAVNGPVATTPA